MLKLISPVSFYFFSVIIRKFKITYVALFLAHSLLLADSTDVLTVAGQPCRGWREFTHCIRTGPHL